MNRFVSMCNAKSAMNFPPAKKPKWERLPVQFAADFPIEVRVRRLEVAPLRAAPQETTLRQTTGPLP